jgi:hypothetical protein
MITDTSKFTSTAALAPIAEETLSTRKAVNQQSPTIIIGKNMSTPKAGVAVALKEDETKGESVYLMPLLISDHRNTGNNPFTTKVGEDERLKPQVQATPTISMQNVKKAAKRQGPVRFEDMGEHIYLGSISSLIL